MEPKAAKGSVYAPQARFSFQVRDSFYYTFQSHAEILGPHATISASPNVVIPYTLSPIWAPLQGAETWNDNTGSCDVSVTSWPRTFLMSHMHTWRILEIQCKHASVLPHPVKIQLVCLVRYSMRDLIKQYVVYCNCCNDNVQFTCTFENSDTGVHLMLVYHAATQKKQTGLLFCCGFLFAHAHRQPTYATRTFPKVPPAARKKASSVYAWENTVTWDCNRCRLSDLSKSSLSKKMPLLHCEGIMQNQSAAEIYTESDTGLLDSL